MIRITAIITLCILLASSACSRRKNGPPFPEHPISVPDAESEYHYINSVKGHDERDSIAGLFDGVIADTLFVIPAKSVSGNVDEESLRYYWDVVSANKTVPILQVFGLCPHLVYEGDLDGNGMDEFGILDTWDASALRNYRVYSYHSYEWRWLIPPIRTAESLRASGKDLVTPGNHPGEVRVVLSDFEAPLSSFALAPDKDTIMVASFEIIDSLPQ